MGTWKSFSDFLSGYPSTQGDSQMTTMLFSSQAVWIKANSRADLLIDVPSTLKKKAKKYEYK